MNYTTASYPGLLKAFYGLQSTLSARNISGYTYPAPTTFYAELFLANSADLSGMNSTLAPLFAFATNETAQGRAVEIFSVGAVVPDYFSIFPQQPNQVDEGAGGVGLLGSRLLPLSTFQGAKLNALANFIAQTPFGIQIHLSKFLSCVNIYLLMFDF